MDGFFRAGLDAIRVFIFVWVILACARITLTEIAFEDL
jgi:hypothetical protein